MAKILLSKNLKSILAAAALATTAPVTTQAQTASVSPPIQDQWRVRPEAQVTFPVGRSTTTVETVQERFSRESRAVVGFQLPPPRRVNNLPGGIALQSGPMPSSARPNPGAPPSYKETQMVERSIGPVVMRAYGGGPKNFGLMLGLKF